MASYGCLWAATLRLVSSRPKNRPSKALGVLICFLNDVQSMTTVQSSTDGGSFGCHDHSQHR